MAIEKINLFVIGAPKSGTTSLCYYLSQHPKINMSEPKEPKYFARELSPAYRTIDTLEEYLDCFDLENNQYEYYCDGSTTYLSSDNAINEILSINPDAKFIAILRNPVERVYSAHGQKVSYGDENESDFMKAWILQESRRQGLNIPRGCKEPLFLQYKERNLIGQQLKRVLELVPESNFLILFMDDLKEDPKKIYKRMMAFLGLEYPGNISFELKNPRKEVKNINIHRMYRRPPVWLSFLGTLKKRIPVINKIPIKTTIEKFNTSEEPKDNKKMSKEVREFLINEFIGEIEQIEKLTGRELEDWKK